MSCVGSHLLQMRGLKHMSHWHNTGKPCRIFYRCVDWNCHNTIFVRVSNVASFTDAWIETKRQSAVLIRCHVASFTDAWIETPPKRGKQSSFGRIFYRCVDWNPGSAFEHCRFQVASFTDAWIETWSSWPTICPMVVASFTDAWIETGKEVSMMFKAFESHLLQMRGLKLTLIVGSQLILSSHLLQMRGLKLDWDSSLIIHLCRIFYRCVDWN